MDNNANTNTTNPTPGATPTPTPTPTPAPKKTNTGLIIGIVVAVVVVVVILPMVFLWMIFSGIINLGMAMVEESPDILNEIEDITKEIDEDIKAPTNIVASTWNCINGTGGGEKQDDMEFTTTVELNEDMTFRYGPYGDLKNNHFSGTYVYEDEKKQNNSGDYNYYMLKFDTKEFMVDGEVQELKNLSDMEMGITKQTNGRGAITIFVSTNNMYYCYDY